MNESRRTGWGWGGVWGRSHLSLDISFKAIIWYLQATTYGTGLYRAHYTHDLVSPSQQPCERVGEPPSLHRAWDQGRGGYIVGPGSQGVQCIGHCPLAGKIGSYFILRSFAKNQHIWGARVTRTLSLSAQAFCSSLNTREASANVLKVPLRSVHTSSQTLKQRWNPQCILLPLPLQPSPRGSQGIPFTEINKYRIYIPPRGFQEVNRKWLAETPEPQSPSSGPVAVIRPPLPPPADFLASPTQKCAALTPFSRPADGCGVLWAHFFCGILGKKA